MECLYKRNKASLGHGIQHTTRLHIYNQYKNYTKNSFFFGQVALLMRYIISSARIASGSLCIINSNIYKKEKKLGKPLPKCQNFSMVYKSMHAELGQ